MRTYHKLIATLCKTTEKAKLLEWESDDIYLVSTACIVSDDIYYGLFSPKIASYYLTFFQYWYNALVY